MIKKNDHPDKAAILNPEKIVPKQAALKYSLFDDHRAQKIKLVETTFAGFIRMLKGVKPCNKSSAQLIKLAIFSGERSSKGSLRSDSTLSEVTGIEGDYDGGKVTPEQAIERIQTFGIRAAVVTTHSHDPRIPRWRVFAPLAMTTKPNERKHLVDCLDAALGNILARESWALSQSYYIGRPFNGEYKVLTTFDDPLKGVCLDECPELKDLIEPHRDKIEKEHISVERHLSPLSKRQFWIENIRFGDNVHANTTSLVASLVKEGKTDIEIREFIASLARDVANQRGQQRSTSLLGHELDRMLSGAREKGFAPKSPSPLPDGLPNVMKFDSQMLPPMIRSFVMDVASRQQCPPDFVAVASICALSALIGRRISIRPKQKDDWTVTPNQWGVIVGRPSAMKSPSMKEALKYIKKKEDAAFEKFKKERDFFEFKKAVSEPEAKQTFKRISKEISKIEDKDAALREAFLNSMTNPPPIRNRLIVNDTTVEKLGELFNENPNGLLLVRDELFGWISKLMQEENQAERAFYLECFDGNSQYTFDRIKRGTIDIKSCTLSVIGGIQPSKIAALVRGAIKGTSDDGLIQRFQLLVWPDDVGNWEWIDREPDQAAISQYEEAINRLQGMRSVAECETPVNLRFNTKAQVLYISWMESIQKIARHEDTHPALESHLMKMPQTVAGLALLFQLLEGEASSVGEEAMLRALIWAEYLQSHANRLYSILNNGDVIGAKLILARRFKLPKVFTIRDVQRKCWAGLDSLDVIAAALNCLEDHSYLSAVPVPTTHLGGRPTVEYHWNSLLPASSEKAN